MAALTVVISGDATKLQAEMLKIEAMAKRTGQNIRTSLNTGGPAVPGGGGGGGHGHPNAGAMREAMVLVRELSRGDFRRAAGSFSILLSRLNLMKLILNPITLGFAALGVVLFGLDRMFKALAPKEDTLGIKSLSRAFDRFQQSAMNAKLATISFFDEMKKGRTEVEKLQAAMKASANITDAWAQSDERKAESEKELALAQLENDKATRKITAQQYAKQKEDLENQFEEQKFKRQMATQDKHIRELYDTADKAEQKHNEARGELGAKTEAAARAAQLRDENEARMGALKETIKELEKKHNEATNGMDKLRAGNALRDNLALYDLAASKQPGLILDADRSKSELERSRADVLGLKKQADDLRKQASEKMVQARAEDVANKAQLDADRKRRALEADTAAHANQKFAHGHVTSLQQVGAFGMQATMVDVARKSHRVLENIDGKMGQLVGKGGRDFGRVKHG